MIELLNIFFLFFSIFIFLTGGILNFHNEKKTSIISIDNFSQNMVLLLSLIWIASIFDLSKEKFFIFLYTLSFIIIVCSILLKKDFKIDILTLFSIFIFFILSIVITNDLFLSHDTRLYWIEKAKIFYNGKFVNDDFTIKNEYPHFGTYLWGYFWKNSYLNYEYVGRIPYLLIYIFAISHTVNVLKTRVYIKLILFLIIILFSYESKYFDGRQDILLFSFNLFIFRFLYEIFINKNNVKKNLILTILLLNLILWTKTDGLLYLIVYGFILFLFLEKKNKLISLFSILFLFVIKVYFYKFWGISLNPSVQMYDANILQRISEIDIFYRLYSIIYWYLINLFKNPLLLISLLILLAIYISDRRFLSKFRYIFIFYVFITLGIFASYLPTMYDFPFAMIGSFDRIILQHSGIFLLPIFYFIVKKLK
ncbi:hypothetical protein [Candidatus Pelagibacter sp.]|uniref:hypothetical protein n=1 Tax=Candidatus Pelagibacter sp. TaxID=2024849 RepID=UPI003F839625